MLIAITAPGQFTAVSSDEPEVGRGYFLEDADEGTNRQGKAWHALVSEYYKSGCSSYSAKCFGDFRNFIKRDLGAGFECFVYAIIENGKPVIKDAPAFGDIPESVRRDPDLKRLVRGRLKSFSDYTKRERMASIDRIIAEMDQNGVRTKKYYEIIEGLNRKEPA
jgi:hypothetical protein